MAGSAGQQKVPETLLGKRFTIPNRVIELPNLKGFDQVIIEKQVFDFSTNPKSHQVVRQFDGETEVVLYGVVTEICVAAAAAALFAARRGLFLVRDAIKELDRAKAENFIKDFIAKGGKLVTTQEVTGSLVAKLT